MSAPSSLRDAQKMASFQKRKSSIKLATGITSIIIAHVPFIGPVAKKIIKPVMGLLENAAIGAQPGEKKRGNEKTCSPESLVKTLTLVSDKPEGDKPEGDKPEDKLVKQQTVLNTIISASITPDAGMEKPLITKLRLELIKINTSETELEPQIIELITTDLNTINTYFGDIKRSKFYKQINKLYEHITPSNKQRQLNTTTDAMNQLFILLIKLLLILQDPDDKHITDFNTKESFDLGGLTSEYTTGDSPEDTEIKLNNNFRRLLVLQELLVFKKNNMFVPLKQTINDLLFLSQQDI